MSTIFRGDPQAEAERRAREQELAAEAVQPRRTIAADRLRRICLDLGADDVGFVDIDREGLGDQRDVARRLLPGVRTLVALVVRTPRENIVSPTRSGANAAWHDSGERLAGTTHAILRWLNAEGVRGYATSVGFPMEVGQWGTGGIWEIAHKVIAPEAGLGHMGINRNVIHPRFGNFILLDTLLIDAEVDRYDGPLAFNPCADCNLCVSVCPVGAISRTHDFDFFACLTHNYREFLGGFADWVHTIADASSADEYRSKYRESETVSMWQSLGYGPQYKSAYCMAVCPAGDDVIGSYLRDKRAFVRSTVRPLKERHEPIYVQSGTKAEQVAARNAAKEIRYVDYAVGLANADNIIRGLQHLFSRPHSEAEDLTATIVIELDDTKMEFVVHAEGRSLRRGDEHDDDRVMSDCRISAPLAVWMDVLNRAASGGLRLEDTSLRVEGSRPSAEHLLAALR